MQYLLAHDLGTSGDKATMFTTDGALAASTVVPAPAKGSRIRPPGSQIFTMSRMSCNGFSVT